MIMMPMIQWCAYQSSFLFLEPDARVLSVRSLDLELERPKLGLGFTFRSRRDSEGDDGPEGWD